MKTLFLEISVFMCLFFGACLGNKKNKLAIIFDRVDNLEIGSSQKIHGIDIGKVSNLKLIDTGVLVKISLSNKRVIPIGSKFSIINPMIGVTYIDIEPSTSNTFLTPKDTVTGKYGEKGLLDNLVSDSTTRKKMKEAYNKIAEGIKELIEAKKDSIRNPQ
jgi:ABC-type transporter Mla subunit MlaD